MLCNSLQAPPDVKVALSVQHGITKPTGDMIISNMMPTRFIKSENTSDVVRLAIRSIQVALHTGGPGMDAQCISGRQAGRIVELEARRELEMALKRASKYEMDKQMVTANILLVAVLFSSVVSFFYYREQVRKKRRQKLATKEDLKRFQDAILTSQNRAAKQGTADCPICLCSFDAPGGEAPKQMALLNCGHRLCLLCASSWFKTGQPQHIQNAASFFFCSPLFTDGMPPSSFG